MKLLRLQRRLEDELGGRFLDLSLHDTVTTLILGGHNKRAEQLARDFRIPDKRWVRISAIYSPGTSCLSFVPRLSTAFLQALVVKAGCPGRFGRLGGAGEVFQEQEITDWLPGEAGLFPRLLTSEGSPGRGPSKGDGAVAHLCTHSTDLCS